MENLYIQWIQIVFAHHFIYYIYVIPIRFEYLIRFYDYTSLIRTMNMKYKWSINISNCTNNTHTCNLFRDYVYQCKIEHMFQRDTE